jgi:hypothetical protein
MRENSVANGAGIKRKNNGWGAREQEMRTIEQKRSLLLLQYSYVSKHSSYRAPYMYLTLSYSSEGSPALSLCSGLIIFKFS